MFNKMLLPACCLVWLVKISLQLHCNYESENWFAVFPANLFVKDIKKNQTREWFVDCFDFVCKVVVVPILVVFFLLLFLINLNETKEGFFFIVVF
jgi:hypothetical protein